MSMAKTLTHLFCTDYTSTVYIKVDNNKILLKFRHYLGEKEERKRLALKINYGLTKGASLVYTVKVSLETDGY